jgi:molybdopterin-biosynthesis enzyme MoeA-like protein
MRAVKDDNQRLYEVYQKVVKEPINEAKKGIRRKVQILEDKIDDFMDVLEKKIDNIDENPVFQQKMYQMLADTVKEHDEFVMAMKRVAATLDSGAKTVPSTKGVAKGNKVGDPNNQDPMAQEQPEDQYAKPNDSQDEFQDQSTTIQFKESKVKKYLGELKSLYGGEYMTAQNPKDKKWYVVGSTGKVHGKKVYVPVSNAFNSDQEAKKWMGKLREIEKDQKKMVKDI